jgi:predicted dehydrogenase
VKFAIFGSGFGLYGYLPALVIGCNQTVYLPERYRVRLEERKDVGCFADLVKWNFDEKAILDVVDAVIVSQRPIDQVHRISECIDRSNIRALLLEKPLAPSPEASSRALDQLEMSGKRYRIGYNFRFMPWAADLKSHLRTTATTGYLSIDWQFRAHHYELDISTWKRFVSAGGGALRFFGIHLIALLAEMGFDAVTRSSTSASNPDECETWSAVFIGPDLPECRVSVQSNTDKRHFSIDRIGRSGTEHLVDLSDPFEGNSDAPGFDRRVGILTELSKDLIHGEPLSYPWYRQSVRLWDVTERVSRQTI